LRENDRLSLLRPLDAGAHSEVRTAADALLQSIELAVAAEELGLDGAYFRVHHFARQLGSPNYVQHSAHIEPGRDGLFI